MDSESFESTRLQLHKQFSSICNQLPLGFQKQVTVKELMDVIPARVVKDSPVTTNEYFSKLPEEEGVKNVLEYLKNHSSILDYNYIKQVTMKFGNVQLQEAMAAYSSSADNFFSSSTVQQLASTCPPQTELPPDFSEMRVQIARDPSAYKLDHLNNLRDRYCCELNMADVLIFTGVLLEAKCFWALWSFPTLHADSLVTSIKGIDNMFLQQEYIVCITVGHQIFHQLAKVCIIMQFIIFIMIPILAFQTSFTIAWCSSKLIATLCFKVL